MLAMTLAIETIAAISATSKAVSTQSCSPLAHKDTGKSLSFPRLRADSGVSRTRLVSPLRAKECRGKEKAPRYSREAFIYVGDDLLSHALSRTVQSARRGLTSVFGMGTGISHAVKSPASLTWARLGRTTRPPA